MPDAEQLRLSYRELTNLKKQKMMQAISGDQEDVEGMLNLKYNKTKTGERTVDEQQPILDYIKTYDQKESLTSGGAASKDTFAAAFQMQIKENLVKTALYNAIKQSMKDASSKRKKLEGLPVVRDPADKLKTSLLDIRAGHGNVTDETVREFKKKIHYGKRLKQRNIEENF